MNEPSLAALEIAAARETQEPRPTGFTRTDLLLCAMVLIWGFNYIVIKAVLKEIEPLAFNALRFGIAGPVLMLLAWVTGNARPAAADIKRFVVLGLIGNFIYQIGFIEGVALTRAGNAALILAAVPVQTAVLSHLRGHERLRPRDIMGLLISSAGIVTIILGSSREVSFHGTMVGDLLIFLSTVCWSFYIVWTKPATDRYGALVVTAWTMAIGAVPIVLVGTPALARLPWHNVSAAAFAGTAASALGALVFAYVVWFRGVRRLGPARTSFYSNFTAVAVTLLAWPMLGEVPTGWQLAGAAGIFTGLWLTRT